MSIILRNLLLLLLVCAGAAAGLAQTNDFLQIRPKNNSPLSRFGLGDPLDAPFAAQVAMGSIQATYQDPYHLNILNPASLAALQTTSFELGLYAKYDQLEDSRGNKVDVWSGNIRYLALGFSLRNALNRALDRKSNNWNAGMAFSLQPTSLVGYDLELEEFTDETGVASNLLKGNGGAYRVSWSNGYRYKNLSVGLNVDYNFGQITNTRVVEFDSLQNSLSTQFSESYTISGLGLGYGAQYTYNFKAADGKPNGKRLIAGVNGRFQTRLVTESDRLVQRVSLRQSVSIRDTIENVTEEQGDLTLPTEINFGLAFDDVNRLFIGAEYGMAAYSNYRNDAQPDRLVDSRRFAVGMQYIPNINSYNSYFKRVRYRLGFRSETDPRQLNGEQARIIAGSFGFGLPLVLPRGQISFVDLSFEVGKFGVPNVIDETYVKFTLGVSLNDNTWFFKRKFN